MSRRDANERFRKKTFNPSPPKPLTPSHLESNFLSVPATHRTLIKHGDQVLFSEPARFECYERFEEIAVVLRQKYGRRVHDLCPTSRSETYLYGDRLAAPRIVDGVRQKLFGASDDADGAPAKSASTELRVMDGLQQIGWNVAFSGPCHVKFDGFEINAVEGALPWRLVHGVQFSGTYFSARTIAEIDFALPARVESLDQLKAFLAYYLDGASDERAKSQYEPAWLVEGRALSALLPWEREQAEYRARDYCTVERDWMRFGLNKLSDSLAGIADGETIDLVFDGSVLRIETTAGLVVVPGNGKAWERSHRVAAGAMRDLPRRLNGHSVCVEAWKGQLRIANRAYPLLNDTDVPAPESPPQCACLGDDPRAAREAIRACEVTDSLQDESHYDASIGRCSRCGQLFLRIFYELIDWRDGDDSQACVAMAITDDQARQIRALSPGNFERNLLALNLTGRQLVACYPRGGGRSCRWADGKLICFPHD